MNTGTKVLEEILNGLMTRYKKRVPDVQKVIDAMIKENIISSAYESEYYRIENDHIAFRTIGVPFLGIQSLEKIFLHCGYIKKDAYHFPKKKLDAYWYAPPQPHYPRIFISELRVTDLSEQSQKIITDYTKEVIADPVDSLDLNDGMAIDYFLHSALWRRPVLQDYMDLSKESEYAAWVIYNRYYLNHFTISVHSLKEGYNTIPSFNDFLERNGFVLNDAGGKYKTSADGLLLQSSTVAKMIDAEFADGKHEAIAGSYVEFAERKILPQFSAVFLEKTERIHRRDGFEANNADKIFESTYASQTKKIIT